MKELLYGINGLLKNETEEYCVYAKKTHNGRYYEYLVRHAVSGPDVPHLLNPWGIHFEQGVSDKQMALSKGKRRYEFKKVTEEVFNMYVSFLETRNERYYREAERALD